VRREWTWDCNVRRLVQLVGSYVSRKQKIRAIERLTNITGAVIQHHRTGDENEDYPDRFENPIPLFPSRLDVVKSACELPRLGKFVQNSLGRIMSPRL
jgi:hypothetical protein